VTDQRSLGDLVDAIGLQRTAYARALAEARRSETMGDHYGVQNYCQQAATLLAGLRALERQHEDLTGVRA
jgi:hypothetical protein